MRYDSRVAEGGPAACAHLVLIARHGSVHHHVILRADDVVLLAGGGIHQLAAGAEDARGGASTRAPRTLEATALLPIPGRRLAVAEGSSRTLASCGPRLGRSPRRTFKLRVPSAGCRSVGRAEGAHTIPLPSDDCVLTMAAGVRGPVRSSGTASKPNRNVRDSSPSALSVNVPAIARARAVAKALTFLHSGSLADSVQRQDATSEGEETEGTAQARSCPGGRPGPRPSRTASRARGSSAGHSPGGRRSAGQARRG